MDDTRITLDQAYRNYASALYEGARFLSDDEKRAAIQSVVEQDCPMCSIIKAEKGSQLTEWFFHNGQIAVVEDLDPKNYDMRLLAVYYFHGDPYPAQKIETKATACGIVGALKYTRGLEIVHVDMDDHSFKDHWHCQVCLNKAG